MSEELQKLIPALELPTSDLIPETTPAVDMEALEAEKNDMHREMVEEGTMPQFFHPLAQSAIQQSQTIVTEKAQVEALMNESDYWNHDDPKAFLGKLQETATEVGLVNSQFFKEAVSGYTASLQPRMKQQTRDSFVNLVADPNTDTDIVLQQWEQSGGSKKEGEQIYWDGRAVAALREGDETLLHGHPEEEDYAQVIHETRLAQEAKDVQDERDSLGRDTEQVVKEWLTGPGYGGDDLTPVDYPDDLYAAAKKTMQPLYDVPAAQRGYAEETLSKAVTGRLTAHDMGEYTRRVLAGDINETTLDLMDAYYRPSEDTDNLPPPPKDIIHLVDMVDRSIQSLDPFADYETTVAQATRTIPGVDLPPAITSKDLSRIVQAEIVKGTPMSDISLMVNDKIDENRLTREEEAGKRLADYEKYYELKSKMQKLTGE